VRRGLVLGAFMPPHAGHHSLIDMARAHVDALTVAVRETPGQAISAALRARWLRESHPDVEVVVIAAQYAAGDSAAWALATTALLGYTPDVLFTRAGADGGLARAFGCTQIAIGTAGETFPISSAQLRTDPRSALRWVQPNVRAYLVRRVCVTGPESTGKTVLCERLAPRFGARWVAEYGREYTLIKGRTTHADRWEPDEFVHIAREQQRREEEAARRADGLVLCDTDAVATEIWLERYLGTQALLGWPVRDRPMDVYLLMDPNVPFVADEIRDGEHLREWMFVRFIEEFERRGLPFVVLDGDYAERERRAIREIEAVLARAIDA
jgi:HTH-type transcriptional repressor of NAD biosynthesis genes